MCIPAVSVAQTPIDSARYYYDAIVNPEKPENLPAGLNYYFKKKQAHLLKKDTLSAISDLRLLAIGEFKIGDYYESENYMVEALHLSNAMPDNAALLENKVGLYNQLGRIYRASKNPTAAINVYDKALKIVQKTKDSIIILNNKANVYKDEQNFDKAMEIYAVLYQKSMETNDSVQIAIVLNNLGYVQSKQHASNALNNLTKALNINEKINELGGQHASNSHLAEYYLDRNDTTRARAYANKALKLARAINSSSLTLDALSFLMRLDESPIARDYKRLADSISNAKQLAENKNAYLKYNLDEEQKKTQASQLAQAVESRKRLIYQFLALFILLLLISSYFLYRHHYRKAKIEEVYKTETRISKQLHDEVANDIYKVMASLENNPGVKTGVLDEIEKIYSKTRNISRENSAIDLEADFGRQLNDLLLGYKSQKVTVVTRNLLKIDWDELSDVKKTVVYRVLQELMTNMRKHSSASSAALIFSNEGSKIQIRYRDNGIGCELLKKNGLRNTESRIATINGSITFESKKDDGFKATLTI
tara:strand:+ start:4681 stop:6288 length:1608 start_codon:yes stop_codon:yes gene_type:complete